MEQQKIIFKRKWLGDVHVATFFPVWLASLTFPTLRKTSRLVNKTEYDLKKLDTKEEQYDLFKWYDKNKKLVYTLCTTFQFWQQTEI